MMHIFMFHFVTGRVISGATLIVAPTSLLGQWMNVRALAVSCRAG